MLFGTSSTSSFSTFKEIDPERLQFVGTPTFDPRPYLDKRGREVFEHPLQNSLDPDCFDGPVPVVKMHCSVGSKVKLFELLDSSVSVFILKTKSGLGSAQECLLYLSPLTGTASSWTRGHRTVWRFLCNGGFVL